jgi:hypothetical protein
VTTRAADATTLQALELTNGETLTRILSEGAAKVLQESADRDGVIEIAYARAFGRKPNPVERETAAAVVGMPPKPEGVADLLWSLVMLPEFQLVY